MTIEQAVKKLKKIKNLRTNKFYELCYGWGFDVDQIQTISYLLNDCWKNPTR